MASTSDIRKNMFLEIEGYKRILRDYLSSGDVSAFNERSTIRLINELMSTQLGILNSIDERVALGMLQEARARAFDAAGAIMVSEAHEAES